MSGPVVNRNSEQIDSDRYTYEYYLGSTDGRTAAKMKRHMLRSALRLGPRCFGSNGGAPRIYDPTPARAQSSPCPAPQSQCAMRARDESNAVRERTATGIRFEN